MSRIIIASIDLSKIDKSRIKDGKNGAKYYDINIMVNDDSNQYGQDVSISEGQTKEERERKDKKSYIGNGKTIWKDDGGTSKPTQQNNTSSSSDFDDLPF